MVIAKRKLRRLRVTTGCKKSVYFENQSFSTFTACCYTKPVDSEGL